MNSIYTDSQSSLFNARSSVMKHLPNVKRTVFEHKDSSLVIGVRFTVLIIGKVIF